MSNYFKYSILTYNHSQLLNEKINVGILFYFPDSNYRNLFFKYPKKLSRLKSLYSDFSEWQLRNYLTAIENKTYLLNNRLNDASRNLFSILEGDKKDLNEIIHNEFIKEDATTLQFSEVKKGKIYDDIENIVRQFYDLYFSAYEENKDVRERHDEEYILHSLKRIITSKNEVILNRFYANKEVKNEKTSCKFEYAWKNGIFNYIKPISFDLVEPKNINYKAIQYKGIFEMLFTNDKNYKLDLLISKPQDDKSIESFREYDKALNILNDTKANKTINEESAFETYADTTISEILSHPESEEENPFIG